MNPDCNILNPLQRDGASQEQRLVRALHPSYVLVDEREISDLLLYAKDYARLIRFFSLENNPSGDWRKFIESDISTLVAIIAEDTLEAEKNAFDVALEQTVADLSDFHRLLSPIAGLIEKAYNWYGQSIPGLKLQTQLEKLINSILDGILRNTVSYAKRLEELGEAVPSSLLSPSFLGANHPVLENITADQSLFPGNDPGDMGQIREMTDRFKQEFQTTLESVLSLIEQAPELLEETLEEYPQHSPQMALFLTFLLLFRIAQDHLNTLTKRHLDFYYQEVLQLDLKPEVPDVVHLILQLAKNFNEHLLDVNTLFRAGKDTNGVNMFYGANNEIVVNKTQLAEDGLKTVFLDKDYGDASLPDEKTPYIIQNIYAAPNADSADGLGADLEEEDGKWATLGNTQMPYARIGFAVSSPIFLLREAQRTITIDLHFQEVPGSYGSGSDLNNAVAHELRHNLTAYYSAEKEWAEVAISRVRLNTSTNVITLELVLEAGDDPFVAHNPDVHEPGVKTTWPTLRFILDNDGLSADYLCFSPTYVANAKEASALIPAYIQQQMVDFINANVRNSVDEVNQYFADRIWIPLAERKIPFKNAPLNYRPGLFEVESVRDGIRNPFVKKKRPEHGLLPVKHVSQILANRYLTTAQFNDLYYSICLLNLQEYNITALKDKGGAFLSGKNYEKGQVVLYDSQYYIAAVDAPKSTPGSAAAAGKWISLGTSPSYPYRRLQPLKLQSMDLQVQVQGMRDLVLENDVGVLNPSKPFLPFGPLPKTGSKFYIGSDEVFKKSLDYVEIDLKWADLPGKGFKDHYAAYRDDQSGANNYPVNSNEDFTASAELLYNGRWIGNGQAGFPIAPASFTLFETADQNDDDPEDDPPQAERKEKFMLADPNGRMNRKLDLAPIVQINPTLMRGFIRFNLQSSFLHKEYPTWLTKAAIDDRRTVPNEPYTPTVSSFSLNYQARQTIVFDEIPFEDRVEQLFHLTPFGWTEFYPLDNDVAPEEAIVSPRLVTEFKVSKVTEEDENAENNSLDAEGTLYIGLTELEPEQNVSILFQVAEGSANPDLNKQQVVWSYLANNRWTDFDVTQILSDTTNGLLTSGIITFVMPKSMTNNNTILPGQKTYWIKGSVAQQTGAVSKAIAVMPQAVQAGFRKEEGNDLSRLDTPLPAETISKLKERKAALKKILQPFASFNGQLKEQNETPKDVTGEDRFKRAHNEFYIRISERLRHKNRAVNIFDYERLVLQQFPDVYKVKCLNHTRIASDNAPASEHAPGFVKVIVLPNLRNRNAVDPLQPKVSLNQLEEIKAFLEPLMSDFVTLEVRNPLFERVNVDFKVKFLPGKDKGFYTKKLKEDIVRFLSPWLYDEGADLQLGGSIHRSVILNKIEETDYVDYLTDFKMNHIIGEEVRPDVEAAVATTSSSVIVSDLADQHIINEVDVTCLNPTTIS